MLEINADFNNSENMTDIITIENIFDIITVTRKIFLRLLPTLIYH